MRAKLVRLGAVALGACVLVVSPLASAQGRAPGAADQGGSNDDKTARKPDAKSEAPVLAFTQSAFGVHESGVGAQATGGGFGTSAGVVEPLYGGQVYGSPTDKLLLLGSAERTLKGEFAPSASVAYRILGSHQDGYALSALGRFKTEGFDEVGGEVETGALFAWTGSKLHLDANAIVGFGLEEEGKKAEGEGGAEGEVDGELKLRFGYDVAAWIRVGLDGQV
ncbi:MAG: hypothetical protein KC492_11120, partial [Myxococcales bacterium]|nr:hypothetical protein [Myxococcales bacterium]